MYFDNKRRSQVRTLLNFILVYNCLHESVNFFGLCDSDLEIKRQIIQGTSSLRLRRKAIEQSLTLENVLKTARAMETANEHTSEM